MAGPLLRSLCSAAARKSSTAGFRKLRAFSRKSRPFSSSTDIPKERALNSIGITISRKVTSISWQENELNMVETPGHADFGGEETSISCKAHNLEETTRAAVDAKASNLEETIRVAVEEKAYHKIPQLLNASSDSCRNPNPFTFLSTFSESYALHIIDEMLQSFISIRPRSQPRKVYSSVLSLTLDTPNHLPLALAIVQRMLRSGCLPPPQTHLLLSKAWLNRRRHPHPVSWILSEMKSIGYSPDCGTCNYLILSLCKMDHFAEAVEVLHGMARAGCVPDLDSFGILIGEMSDARMIDGVVELIKEMVCTHLLDPRKETLVKAMKAMRANKEARRAVEMVEFLEGQGVAVGFEVYESGLEGCLESRQFVLAGKFAVRMTERGFIPFIRVRQRLFEGLVGIGEAELASVVRQRFSQLKS